jgi:hypothetical protein
MSAGVLARIDDRGLLVRIDDRGPLVRIMERGLPVCITGRGHLGRAYEHRLHLMISAFAI